MRSFPRLVAGLAVVAALTLVAGACNTAPYAARVNGRTILSTELTAELGQLSANKRYIAAIDSSGSGLTVTGAAPGTYSSKWTA
ncbi:MAG TPA: hypothetical protein VKV25_08775, partial [Acidimicrobiales bacterium]|nr:hypothetical protein [Acidimicrobiales bacterium]